MTQADCRICTRPVASPWRIYDEHGNIINGCVSADHDGHLTTPSASAAWHARKEAKLLRRAEAAGRK